MVRLPSFGAVKETGEAGVELSTQIFLVMLNKKKIYVRPPFALGNQLFREKVSNISLASSASTGFLYESTVLIWVI